MLIDVVRLVLMLKGVFSCRHDKTFTVFFFFFFFLARHEKTCLLTYLGAYSC